MEELKVLLKDFKPILILYFPISYIEDNNYYAVDVLKKKLYDDLEGKYIIMAIPSNEYLDFTLDILSVLKSNFVRDIDLEKLSKSIEKNVKRKPNFVGKINDIMKGFKL